MMDRISDQSLTMRQSDLSPSGQLKNLLDRRPCHWSNFPILIIEPLSLSMFSSWETNVSMFLNYGLAKTTRVLLILRKSCEPKRLRSHTRKSCRLGSLGTCTRKCAMRAVDLCTQVFMHKIWQFISTAATPSLPWCRVKCRLIAMISPKSTFKLSQVLKSLNPNFRLALGLNHGGLMPTTGKSVRLPVCWFRFRNTGLVQAWKYSSDEFAF